MIAFGVATAGSLRQVERNNMRSGAIDHGHRSTERKQVGPDRRAYVVRLSDTELGERNAVDLASHDLGDSKPHLIRLLVSRSRRDSDRLTARET